MDWTTYVPLALVIVVLMVLKAWIDQRGAVTSANYRLVTPLLTPAERSFFGVLEQALGEDHRIFTKVRVADVLLPEKGMRRSAWQVAFNRISQKHFDFVVCAPDTLATLFVVELNDSSHSAKTRQKRDQLLREACDSAGLQLMEFDAKRTYSISDVRARCTSSNETAA